MASSTKSEFLPPESKRVEYKHKLGLDSESAGKK